MEISELKVGQGKVDIELNIKIKENVRTFNKFGKESRVCNVIGVDSAGGEIKVTLWNDEVDKVNAGDKIKITNGYVSEFNGQKQLSAGKYGKLEVVSSTGKSHEEPKKEKKESKKKAKSEEEEEFDDEEPQGEEDADEEDSYF